MVDGSIPADLCAGAWTGAGIGDTPEIGGGGKPTLIGARTGS